MYYIARDKDGTLKIFKFEPHIYEFVKGSPVFLAEGPMFKIDKKLFIDEVTFENSPQIIDFKKLQE